MTAARKIQRCSCTTSNTVVLRAELGMYPLQTNSDMRELKRQYKVRNMPKKRLSATVDRAVWKKVTKGRAGIRWGSVVVKIMEGYRGKPRRVGVRREVWEVQGRLEEMIEINKGKASAKKQGGIGKNP